MAVAVSRYGASVVHVAPRCTTTGACRNTSLNLQTTNDRIYAAGDVIGEPASVYTAAYEGTLAVENALGGTLKARDYTALPWVVFTDPQVSGVGMDERQAAAAGLATEAVAPWHNPADDAGPLGEVK